MNFFDDEEIRDEPSTWTDVFINAERAFLGNFLTGFFIAFSAIILNWNNSIIYHGNLSEKLLHYLSIVGVCTVVGIITMIIFWLVFTPVSMIIYRLKWRYKIFLYILIGLLLSIIFLNPIFSLG